jgi:hypothetical protein
MCESSFFFDIFDNIIDFINESIHQFAALLRPLLIVFGRREALGAAAVSLPHATIILNVIFLDIIRNSSRCSKFEPRKDP